MKVHELIDILKTKDQNLDVVIEKWSEYIEFEAEYIREDKLCEPRNDGWVARKRDDKPVKDYLILES